MFVYCQASELDGLADVNGEETRKLEDEAASFQNESAAVTDSG